MKKKTSIILIIALFISAMGFKGAADSLAYTQEADEFKDVLYSLNENLTLDGDANVSRAIFTKNAVNFFLNEENATQTLPFEDVAAESSYASAISTAYAVKWISDSKIFRPDEEITMGEAVKILVTAMGYEMYANKYGGYPYGYLTAAKRLDLPLKKQIDEKLSYNDMAELFYNVLFAGCPEIDEISDDSVHFDYVGKTFLKALYAVDYYDGILNETNVNSISISHKIETGNKYIEIAGNRFQTDFDCFELIGRKCRVFYKDGSAKEAVCVMELKKENNIEKYSIADFLDLSGRELKFDTQKGSKKIKVDGAYKFFLNGRAALFDKSLFEGESGEITLIDNNRDGAFDIISVEKYDFYEVRNTDTVNSKIYGSDAKILNVDNTECFVKISDENENVLSLTEIARGDVFAVKKSEDGCIVTAERCTQKLSGKILSIDIEKRVVEIGENKLYLPKSVEIKSANDLILGNEITVIVFNGTLAFVSGSQNNYKYGFLVGVDKEGLKDFLYIFTQDGEFAKIYTDGKITVDGTKGISEQSLITSIEGGKKHQLVKFVAKDNVLRKIDFHADAALDAEYSFDKNQDDALTKYYFGSVTYKGATKGFPPYCEIENSVVFAIPEDIDDYDNYMVGSHGIFSSGLGYNGVDIYDIDKNGHAAAALYRGVHPTRLVNSDGLVVIGIRNTTDNDGDNAYLVNTFGRSGYACYTIKESLMPKKPLSKLLKCGDIIRVATDSKGEVHAAAVDFIADGFAENKANGGLSFASGSECYYKGKVYNSTQNYIWFSDVKDSLGDNYVFTPQNLKHFPLNTTNIIKVSYDRKDARLVTYNDIKGYLSARDNADYIVIRQKDYALSSVFVYESEAEQ